MGFPCFLFQLKKKRVAAGVNVDLWEKRKQDEAAVLEQLKLINELDNEEKNILLKLIETFIPKKRFKEYLQKNIATL
jgi:hypothetical protein